MIKPTLTLLVATLLLPALAAAANNPSQTAVQPQAADCSATPPSFGLVRQTRFVGGSGPVPPGTIFVDDFGDGTRLTQWQDLFGTTFPTRAGNATAGVEQGKFVALEFNTGLLTDPGYAGSDLGTVTVVTPAAYPGNVLLSYSSCPGQFETLPNSELFCRMQASQGAWSWMVNSSPGQFVCTLAENTTYYLNIAHVDFSTGVNNCSGSPCQVFLQPR